MTTKNAENSDSIVLFLFIDFPSSHKVLYAIHSYRCGPKSLSEN